VALGLPSKIKKNTLDAFLTYFKFNEIHIKDFTTVLPCLSSAPMFSSKIKFRDTELSEFKEFGTQTCKQYKNIHFKIYILLGSLEDELWHGISSALLNLKEFLSYFFDILRQKS
jgi:hypothetical protein